MIWYSNCLMRIFFCVILKLFLDNRYNREKECHEDAAYCILDDGEEEGEDDEEDDFEGFSEDEERRDGDKDDDYVSSDDEPLVFPGFNVRDLELGLD